MTPAAYIWASVGDISRVYDVPPATIYRWAHRDAWRRLRQDGRSYYHWYDVADTAERLTQRDRHERLPE
jgi:hypothetical protein